MIFLIFVIGSVGGVIIKMDRDLFVNYQSHAKK
jgi:hypothetical protein